MGNLRIGNRQPSVGTIKQGGANVAKIYKGDNLLWPLGGEPDNYEPLPDDNVRFVGLYNESLITYFTNVQDPFDSQYIDQTISYTGMENRIYDHITAVSDNMQHIYAISRTGSDVKYLLYRSTYDGAGLSFARVFGVDKVDSISKDGQYVYGLSFVRSDSDRTTLKTSSDYGQTFSAVVDFNDPNNPHNIVDYVACSMGGKYVYATFNVQGSSKEIMVYKSDDYGSSFSIIPSSITGLVRGNAAGLDFLPIVSGNGQYVYFCVKENNSYLPSGNIITMSDNFGTSFFQNSVDLRSGSRSANNQTDKYGKYLILTNFGSNEEGLVSTDYSLTAQSPAIGEFYYGVGVSTLSNFGTIGLMESSRSLTTSSPNQEVAISVDFLQSFNELEVLRFPSGNYGPIQKVVNII